MGRLNDDGNKPAIYTYRFIASKQSEVYSITTFNPLVDWSGLFLSQHHQCFVSLTTCWHPVGAAFARLPLPLPPPFNCIISKAFVSAFGL